MNTDKLSDRLYQVSTFIEKGMILADIGSDHAYLPCFVVKSGKINKAIAGEVVHGPYHSALSQVEEQGLSQAIDVRLGNGLDVIERGEVTCITICGMGGALISTILEQGKAKLAGGERLILQPNVGSDSVRTWLFNEGWQIKTEKIMEETGKLYEIIVAEKGDPAQGYHDIDFKTGILLGPILLKNQNTAFKKKWDMEIKQWEHILTEMKKSKEQTKTVQKQMEMIRKIELVKGALDK